MTVPSEVIVEVVSEVPVLVPTVLEPDVAEWTVVVLVAATIVLLTVDDTVVVPLTWAT
jgi:hypothetical protein